ncbi:hypothetical protein ACH3VR_18015 [Microbacterium sp. B2969]|uniref:DUF3618 domain-containing protein n=1 Tax=Microbacterium alkaliflavum TaxID=3248839 RepID=A0ABW7QBL2_9MICO
MSDTRDTLPTGGSSYPTTTSPTENTSTTGKPSAGDVVDTAKQEAAGVADTAKEQAKEVGREAKTQLKSLYHQTRDEVSDQAAHRQQRLADGLRSAGDELRGMADSSSQNGVASDVVRQVSHRLDHAGSWLSSRDPGQVLDEVKRYARRRPVVFLAAAAVAGIVVGRLTRSLAAGSPSSPSRYTGTGYTGSGYPGATGSGYPGTNGRMGAYDSGDGYRAPDTGGSGTPIYDATSSSPTLRSTAADGTRADQEPDDALYRQGEVSGDDRPDTL